MLSLSLLVLIHEFGHFIFARIFKVRVEKFYLFFDPWFSLFKFKPKNSETEYGVGMRVWIKKPWLSHRNRMSSVPNRQGNVC